MVGGTGDKFMQLELSERELSERRIILFGWIFLHMVFLTAC